jgi:hypothetical protein
MEKNVVSQTGFFSMKNGGKSGEMEKNPVYKNGKKSGINGEKFGI